MPDEASPLRAPAGPHPEIVDESQDDDAAYGSCHICWGAGVVEDVDCDRDCSACNGTGDITQGDRSERSTS